MADTGENPIDEETDLNLELEEVNINDNVGESVEPVEEQTNPSGAGDMQSTVNPEDSASNVSQKSTSSSASKMRFKNKQREIELKSRLEAHRENSRIEEEKLRLSRLQTEINLRAQLRAATEIEDMFASSESEVTFKRSQQPLRVNLSQERPNVCSDDLVKTRNPVTCDTEEISSNLNPGAENFVTKTEKQSNSTHDLVAVFKQLVEHQKDQVLPDQEIEPFSGKDVLLYQTFINNFEVVIEHNTEDPSRRLQFLLKYTVGEAYDLIQFTPLIKDPADAYAEARRLLQQDFGNPQLVASSFISKAETFEKIKAGDKIALRKFAIFLVNCINSKQNNNDMNTMDGIDFIKMLCSKLPGGMQQKWIAQNGKIREHENRSANLKDFESFVGLLSRNENDPRVSGLGYQQRPTQQSNSSKPNTTPRKAFTTQVKPVSEPPKENLAANSPCLYCGLDTRHCLLDCRKFANLSCEGKSDAVRKLGLCYGCLNPGHMKETCEHKQWVHCELCTRSHMTVMHDPSRENTSSNTKPKSKMVTSSCAMTSSVLGERDPLMAILPVKVKAPANGFSINTYLFVDNGFSSVFVTDELSDALCLRNKTVNLSVKTVNDEKTVKSGHITDPIHISNLKGENPCEINSAFIRETMPVTLEDAPTQSDLAKWKHLRNIKLPKLSGICIPSVSIMIGMGVPSATTPLEIIKGEIGEPYAIRSPLGHLFYGLPGKLASVNQTSVNFCQIDSNLEKQVKKYFNLEFSERLCDEKPCMSKEDKTFMEIMDKTTVFENGHYKMDIPFRDPTKTVPNNKVQAELFALRLRKRLSADKKLCEQYVSFMDKLEINNYCEKVPIFDLQRNDGRVWYLPHHPVINPKKPDKVRVVFNCPVEYKGVSLNNLIYPGPNLMNGLLGVILRWRQYPVAIMADIETYFYRTRVSVKDTDMLRFIWWPNGDLNEKPVEYRMLVHIFGCVSSPSCCNYALKRVASDNVNSISDSVAQSIEQDYYMDDLLKSVETEEEAIALAREMCSILKSCGFNLTKWISNSRNFLKTVPQAELVESTKTLNFDIDELPTQRALGVKWCTETDKIKFKVSEIDTKSTRRNILSVMSSIYDPIGFASPFVLRCKIILQNLCRLKLSWDETIPEDFDSQWKSWLSDLPNLEHFAIDRCLKPKSFGAAVKTELHHFADASAEAYASVSYARFVNEQGDIHVAFLLGRSRVAPIRSHTIVKLELSAATSLVRINHMLIRELSIPVDEVYFWTDSQTVLKYIANESSRHQVFVTNRLAVIRDGSDLDQWHYVPSKLNPADHASRGLSAENLDSVNWLSGPQFLMCSSDSWPVNSCEYNVRENICNDKEIFVNSIKISQSAKDTIDRLYSHYSEYNRLLRGVSWLMRLKNILKCKIQNRDIPQNLCCKSLSNEEVLKAECALLCYVQKCEFVEEFEALESQASSVKMKSSLANLNPKIVKNLICVGGRLQNASIPDTAKNQIILPKGHIVSRLIVKECHKKVGHQGRNHTLAQIRKKYWIIQCGVLVKNVLRKCVVCKKLNSRVGQQQMADLPTCRVQSDQKAFACTGIDFFGPYEIKIGRSIKKRYCVVFTCFSSRAIHIEVAESLDTSSCVAAIRRFMARRGVPKNFYSDNGTNLVGANKELSKSVKDLDQETFRRLGIQFEFDWNFNPPTASHHGGVWERMIRTIRKVLQAILSEQFLKSSQNEEQLRTLMCEVEFIINSRPLTRVSEDPNDLSVITPNSLLLLEPIVSYPPGLFCDRDIYAKRRWRQMQYLADLFWKMWTLEYLPLLQQRQKWLQPKRNFQVGDIALIVDDNSPRCSWPLGLILETYPNKNGLVRSVKLRTQFNTLIRPIAKLCLLLEGVES